jgi:hypothetical protein
MAEESADVKLRQMLQAIAKSLDKLFESFYGRRMGLCLLVFPFASDPVYQEQKRTGCDVGGEYVSNADRDDMVHFLRETADRLEQRHTVDSPIGEA